MKRELKPIVFSQHSLLQMKLRGAKNSEVINVIRKGKRQIAKLKRKQAKLQFFFNKSSPITGKKYKLKDVEVIFIEETKKIVVITVKIYYSNEEVKNEDFL